MFLNTKEKFRTRVFFILNYKKYYILVKTEKNIKQREKNFMTSGKTI